MDARNDPNYLRLYREYAAAIRAFENASRDRRRVRNRLKARRSPDSQPTRRPVGSPPGTRIPPEPQRPPRGAEEHPHVRHVYMGEILGWATLRPAESVEAQPDAVPELDADELYDRLSLKLYWNAKSHYLDRKRAFFDYVRRQNLDTHRAQARDALDHGARLQLLGVDDESLDFLAEARREVDAACENAWKLYQSSPTPKSFEAKVLLVESIADAQYVDLESPTVRAMQAELQHLVSSGAVQQGER